MEKEDYASGKDVHQLLMEVFQLQRALSDFSDIVHEQTGLSTTQRKILRVIEASDRGMTVPDIAALLGTSRQFVQKTCNDLEEVGDIAFVTNPRHKRSKHITITEQGKVRWQDACDREHAYIDQMLPVIERNKVVEAASLLKRIRIETAEVVKETLRDSL